MTDPGVYVKNIFVSSINRDTDLYPYGNSYTLHFTNPIKNVERVELVYGSIPNTMYNLTQNTNFISFSNAVTGQDPTKLTSFTLPQGFYGAAGLSQELNFASSNITNITCSFLPNEGKFLFTRPLGSPFCMRFNTEESAMLMGFEPNTVLYSMNVPFPPSVTNVGIYQDHYLYRNKEFVKSSKVFSLNPNDAIFLDIQELRTVCNEDAHSVSSPSGTYSGQNMTRSFGLIPIDVSSGGIVHFNKGTNYDLTVSYPYPIQKIDRLTIRWINKYGETVNFNGLEDNSFLLRFHSIKNV